MCAEPNQKLPANLRGRRGFPVEWVASTSVVLLLVLVGGYFLAQGIRSPCGQTVRAEIRALALQTSSVLTLRDSQPEAFLNCLQGHPSLTQVSLHAIRADSAERFAQYERTAAGVFVEVGGTDDTLVLPDVIDRLTPGIPFVPETEAASTPERAYLRLATNAPDEPGTLLALTADPAILSPPGALAGQQLALLAAYVFLATAAIVWLMARYRRCVTTRVEARLRQMEAIVEQNPCSIVITDAKANIEYVNPRFCEITGWTAEEVRGRNPRVLKSGNMTPEAYEALWSTLKSGRTWQGEFLNVKKDGQLFWESASISPILDREGQVTHYVAVKEDITVRKLEETVLKRSNSLLEAQQEAVVDGLLVVDEYDRVSSFNERFCQLWQLRASSLEYEDERDLFRELAALLEKPEPLLELQRDLSLQARRSSRGQVTTRTGEVMDCYCSPIVSPAGEYYGRLWTFRDITESSRYQQQIRLAKESAEDSNLRLAEAMERVREMAEKAGEANQSKSEFLANMSHEIRTPMNAVMGMTTLLRDTTLTPEQQDYVDIIRNSSDSLLTIVNDILDFSKIEAGKLTMESIGFSVVSVFEDTLDLVSSNAAEKELDLVYEVGEGVPAHVKGDPTRLRQVLVNLAGNAVKFTETGEVKLFITLVERDKDEVVLRFSVKDTGIGISSERVHRLFKPFSQADNSTTRKYGGTGLGLVISRRLCEMMRGRIWVQSEEGVGSTFHFEVCLEALEQPPVDAALVELLCGKRLLVVDRNPANTALFAYHTRSWEMTTLQANTGAEAMRLLEAGPPPDLAIVDNQLNDIDGYSLISKIRAHRASQAIPIVLFTTMGMRKMPERMRTLQISGVLTKPVKQASLEGMLTRALSRGERFTSRSQPPIPLNGKTQPPMPTGKGLRILLVEDNAVNQKVALLLLKRLGHNADVAANGREGIEAIRRQSYDLVFMDLHMPEMGGLEATRHILELLPAEEAPYIVAMTAAALQTDRNAALQAGMKAFITKPVKVEEVERVLKLVRDSVRAAAASEQSS
ncbi:MAG: response regulator [Opitutales bacterium]